MESVDSLIKTTMDEIQKVLSTRTVVGEPITLKEMIIVPLVSIGFAFGAGGGSGKDERRKGAGEGGGSGGGAWVKPIAIVIADKEGIKIEPIRGGFTSALEKIGETIPQTMMKCCDTWRARREERGSEEQ